LSDRAIAALAIHWGDLPTAVDDAVAVCVVEVTPVRPVWAILM
jgi:hypothetical protein